MRTATFAAAATLSFSRRLTEEMGVRGLYVPALCASLWLGAVCAAGGQQSDAREGARRFEEYCAGCHGTDGRGGAKGPSLAGAPANRSDAELSAIVSNGTRGGMPPFAQIGGANIEALVHFLRLLQGDSPAKSSQPEPLPGDARAGRALFFGKAQCSSCHMINGQGGFMARGLTHYGRNLSADAIRAAIVDPDNPLIPSARVVTVTTRAGQTLTGVLRNEDEFNVDLQTEDGRHHLLKRSDVTHVDYTLHSLMPRDYATRLSRAELNDIVSILMATGREPQASEASGR